MSGVRITSFVGCILMSLMVKSYYDMVGVAGQLLDNGDDALLIFERADLPKMGGLSGHCKSFGFTITLEEPVYEVEHIDFCQSMFINLGDEYTMTRRPKQAITKDCVSLTPFNTERHYRGWLDSVGTGGLALNSGIPVMQAYYMMYIRNGKHMPSLSGDPSMETGTRMLSMNMPARYVPVTEESRFSFYVATGVLPDVQIYLENYYAAMTMEYGPGKGTPLAPDIWVGDGNLV